MNTRKGRANKNEDEAMSDFERDEFARDRDELATGQKRGAAYAEGERRFGKDDFREDHPVGTESHQENRIGDTGSQDEDPAVGSERYREDRIGDADSYREDRLNDTESDRGDRVGDTRAYEEDRFGGGVDRDVAAATAGGGAGHAPLFASEDSDRFRERWMQIQTQFVDEPRRSVEQADDLVAEVTDRITSEFSRNRDELERQWTTGGEVSTEDLRRALRSYRSFFERLLSL